MPDAPLILLLAATAAAVLAAPIAALVALVRAREARDRVRELERRLAQLEGARRLAAAEPGAAERAEPAAQPPPSPIPPREALRPPAPSAATPPARPGATAPAGPVATRPTPPAATRPTHPGTSPLPPLPPRRRLRAAPDSAAPAAPRRAVDWERWIGVRGTVLVAGVALALGGILLFRHAVESGWITPPMRVAGGAAGGLAAVAGALVAERKRLRHVPGALAGAGVATLYTCAWAAHRLYDLVPFGVAFAGMALVTAGCVALAWRLRAQLVAVLGLCGGFLTPLLVGADPDRPLFLFGYLLVLDLGLLAAAARLRWPLLGALGLAATFAWQLQWALSHADAEHAPAVLAMAAVFAGLFAAGARTGEGRVGLATRAGGVALPMLLALHLAARPETGAHLWPEAALVALLAAGAALVARQPGAAWLRTAAAGATVVVPLAWLLRSSPDGAGLAELAGVSVGLALALQGLAKLDRRAGRSAAAPPPDETLAALGLLAVAGAAGAVVAAPPLAGPWPLAGAWTVLALLAARPAGAGASLLARRVVPAVAFLAAGGAVALWARAHAAPAAWALALGGAGEAPSARAGALAALALAMAAAVLADGLARRSRERLALGLPAFALPLLLALPSVEGMARAPEVSFGLTLLLALAASAAGLAGRSGWPALGAGVLCALSQAPGNAELLARAAAPAPWLGLALALATAAAFLAPPLAAPLLDGGGEDAAASRARRLAWRGAALALVAGLPGAQSLWERAGLAPGVAPALLGAAALGASLLARRTGVRASDELRAADAWLQGTGAALVALALPVQVGHDAVPVGAAAIALALALCARRLGHGGLAVTSSACGVAAALATLAGALVGGRFPRSPLPAFDRVGYGTLLPALLVLAGAAVTAPLARAAGRAAVRRLSACAGAGGLLAAFAWINLEIFDHYGDGALVAIDLERLPARDLVMSIAWALYALVLLGAGMASRSSALRWSSLAFLLPALAKVFLYDLGELDGLFRVASLCGLALSLLLVSVLYQRFVFRRGAEA